MSATVGRALRGTRERLETSTAPAAVAPPPPVKYWAFAGAVLLAAELFVLGKWVFGPNFTEVQSGPDVPPEWMKAVLISVQVIASAATVFTLYWFIVRPWRREHRVTTDGLLCIAFLLAAPFDMLANFAQNWFTYNSYLVNMGSVMGEIPGVTAFHEAGANEAFPLLIVPTAYVTVFIWLAILGCKVMSAAKRRWPQIGPGRLIAVCLAFTLLADIVIEGLLYMPLGFWSYGGGHWLINGGEYYQYPLHEMLFGGAVFAMFVCLRYFTNDKGETIAERGIDRVKTSPSRKVVLRGLALIAAVHIGFIVTYHLPNSLFALNSEEWPADVQERSYFTNNICGPETDRACPGPTVPNQRPDSPYLGRDGDLVQPGSGGEPD